MGIGADEQVPRARANWVWWRRVRGGNVAFPPGATRTGKRYYAISRERLGKIGIYCGWGRFREGCGERHALPHEYFGEADLEQAIGRLGTRVGFDSVELFF